MSLRCRFLVLTVVVLMTREAPAEVLELGGGATLEILRVEPGEFQMGSPASEPGRNADETLHRVALTRPVFLGRFPVTVRQWRRFVEATGYRSEAEDGKSGGYGWNGQGLVQGPQYTWRNPGFSQSDDHPVTMVTWPDTQAFLRWLQQSTGRVCRLPTEAEWEYACRAGTATPWPTGDTADAWAWHRGNSPGTTQPVGRKEANAWGFQDMGGQVWEWCQDWYGPYDAAMSRDPVQTSDRLSDKPRRVLRGGSFLKDPSATRSATRYRNDPRSRNADNGFRVAVLVPPPSPAVRPATVPSPAPPVPAVPPGVSPMPLSGVPEDASHDQPHDVRETHEVRRRSGGIGRGTWVILAVVGWVVWRVVRRLLSPPSGAAPVPFAPEIPQGGPPSHPQPPATRLAADGFYITGSIVPGALVHWQAETVGGAMEGEAAFTPGPDGLFIFTGARPLSANVRVAVEAETDVRHVRLPDEPRRRETTALDDGLRAGWMAERIRDDAPGPPPLPQADPPRRSSRGFPSAY